MKRFIVEEINGRWFVTDRTEGKALCGFEVSRGRSDGRYFADICARALNEDFEECRVFVERLEKYYGVNFGPDQLT